MVKLHVVYGHDNDRYGFREAPGVVRCELCGEIADKWNLRRRIVVHRPDAIAMDISTTYDGAVVVSRRFRSAVDDARLTGLTFEEVGSGYAVLWVDRRVKFDAQTRMTRFENPCARCGTYESVIGATPAFLMPPVDIGAAEFVWTDIEFGSGDEKSPLLICGDQAAKVLRGAKLKGLDFAEVRNSPRTSAD